MGPNVGDTDVDEVGEGGDTRQTDKDLDVLRLPPDTTYRVYNKLIFLLLFLAGHGI